MSPADEKELLETIEGKILEECNRLRRVNYRRPNVLILNEYTYILLRAAVLRYSHHMYEGFEVSEWRSMKIVRLEPKQAVDSMGIWFSFGTMPVHVQ